MRVYLSNPPLSFSKILIFCLFYENQTRHDCPMAFTQTQLDALDSALAQGVLSVQYNDRRVTYHSLNEMITLRTTMRSELGVATPAANRGRIINLPTGRGL